MKYFYFPSSCLNKESKRRRRGGAVRGYGYMIASSLEGVKDVKPLDPETLPEQE